MTTTELGASGTSGASTDAWAAGQAAVEVRGLRKSFGATTALDGLDLTVARGEILGLLGRNGAGKTTLINILSTLLRPDSGTGLVAGHDVVADPAAVRRSIALTGQYAALDAELTGYENLVVFGRLWGLSRRQAQQRARELLAEFGLTEAADRRVGRYSGGMRRRVDLAVSVITRPAVLFLDEPTTGLDPHSRLALWETVRGLREQGVTIVLTTQYLEEADQLADRIVVVDRGRVVAEGTADELRRTIGGTFCEVRTASPAQTEAARAVLADLGAAVAVEGATLSLPAPDGPVTLTEVLRRMEAAGIPLADISLRRPSLDEVFLTLTGRPDAPAPGGGERS